MNAPESTTGRLQAGLLSGCLAVALMAGGNGTPSGAQRISRSAAQDPQAPSSVIVTAGGEDCSGTLIGPSVLLTSAHCLSGQPSQIVRISLFMHSRSQRRMAGGRLPDGDGSDVVTVIHVPGKCTPLHADGNCPDVPDVALCRMIDPSDRLGRLKPFATVGHSDLSQSPNAPLLVLGFGGSPFGTLKTIAATLDTRAGPSNGCARIRSPQPSVVQGDSGGGVYLRTADGRGALVGVISSQCKVEGDPCGISNLATPEVTAFFNQTRAKGVKICGFDADLRGSCEP